MTGRFGPYVQLGETPEKGSKEKPRRASLTADDGEATITLDRALELLSLPRLVGLDPEAGEEIVANFGRFGPYIKRGSEYRSLASDAQVFEVTLDEAIELFRQEKPSRRTASTRVLRELGAHPDSGAAVRLLEGRYGPYVSDGTTNASLPKDVTSEAVALDTRGRSPPRSRGRPEGRTRAHGCRTARRRVPSATTRRKTSARKRPA